MNTSKKEVLDQIKFCKTLMEHFYEDCINNMEYHHSNQDDERLYFVHKRSVMKQDSIRLRRELNNFNKLINL
jgi:hypothetical protein